MGLQKLRKIVLADEIVGFECDCCKKQFTSSKFEDHVEIAECFHGESRCGYGSVFGDEVKVSLTLCQHCFKERLGDCIQVTEEA